MNREFLETYNRELAMLYERAREFAEEYPGIAERLGGLTEEKLDPGLAGLLEGSAFLAARVQMKLQSEFSTFTRTLLEQLLPNYLAPTPSAMIVEAKPDFGDADLVKGRHFPAGAYLDANYVERDQRVSCRYRLSAPLSLWPLAIDKAEYLTGPGPLQTLGLEVLPETAGGLRLRFTRRTGAAAPAEDAPPDPKARPAPVSEVRAEVLPVHIQGAPADAAALYEQIFARCRRISLRYLDSRGDPVFLRAPAGTIRQIGFLPEERLFPEDADVFAGFSLLREFYVLPQKFMGFRLEGLGPLLSRIPAQSFDLILEFDRVQPRLANVVSPATFRLYAAPAINLFEEVCSPVPIGPGQHEHLVTPDATPAVNYEIQRLIEVSAFYKGARKKARAYPVYSLPEDGRRPQDALYYARRQRPRRLTERERRLGAGSDYIGTETLIALHEPAGLDDEDRVQRLRIVALASNRHLPAHLPIGKAAVDFRLNEDTTVTLSCIAGPTPPRDSIVAAERRSPRTGNGGEILWRLVNMLSFNALGLKDRHGGDPAAGLRELLSLFADLSDAITERQVRGLIGVASRPITRSIRRPDGYHAARGTEVVLTFDERAFEGSGIALLGALLDRFLADYVHLNSFTETVIASQQRGEVMRWPARSGTGPVL